MPIVSDRPVVIELARKRLASAGANPRIQDREAAARGALFEHYGLVEGDSIWGASEAAICMGWSGPGEEENLLERIVADVAAELA